MMGPGTLEAKVVPLSKTEEVSDILFIRKETGPQIPKVNYITLGKLGGVKIFHWVISPLIVLKETIRFKPAVLISYHIIPYGFFVGLVGLITKTPYVIGQTGLMIQKQAKHKLFRQFLYFIFKYSFQVNCPGTKSVEYWGSIFPKLQGKFKVLHSTIDSSYFKSDEKVPKKYDFIFLGRLHRVKNIDIILQGFAHLVHKNTLLNHPTMVIVGNGPEEKKLRALSLELGLESLVSFTGFISEPLKYLQESRFLVMDSDSEGLPTAMMQAMSCELIPITSLVGNILDLVSDRETGFVHIGKNVESISEMMFFALQKEEEALLKMRTACRKRVINKHSHLFATTQWQEVLCKLS